MEKPEGGGGGHPGRTGRERSWAMTEGLSCGESNGVSPEDSDEHILRGSPIPRIP